MVNIFSIESRTKFGIVLKLSCSIKTAVRRAESERSHRHRIHGVKTWDKPRRFVVTANVSFVKYNNSLPVHYSLVCSLPLLLISVGANVRIQFLQVDSGDVGPAPHRHWNDNKKSVLHRI